jgi:hypothetical protein
MRRDFGRLFGFKEVVDAVYSCSGEGVEAQLERRDAVSEPKNEVTSPTTKRKTLAESSAGIF